MNYTIDLEKESKSNINFNVAQNFESKYILNDLEYVKNLKIISDVSPEDIQFNWPFVIAIIICIVSSVLLYIPLGFCWYYLHKKRFEESESKVDDIYSKESKDDNNRMKMIELQALNKQSDTPINNNSHSQSDLHHNSTHTNIHNYDLNNNIPESKQ